MSPSFVLRGVMYVLVLQVFLRFQDISCLLFVLPVSILHQRTLSRFATVYLCDNDPALHSLNTIVRSV